MLPPPTQQSGPRMAEWIKEAATRLKLLHLQYFGLLQFVSRIRNHYSGSGARWLVWWLLKMDDFDNASVRNWWSLYVSNGSFLCVSIPCTAAEGRPRVSLTWKVWAYCGNDTWEMFDAQSLSDVLWCHLEGFSQCAMLLLSSIWAMWVSQEYERNRKGPYCNDWLAMGLQQVCNRNPRFQIVWSVLSTDLTIIWTSWHGPLSL